MPLTVVSGSGRTNPAIPTNADREMHADAFFLGADAGFAGQRFCLYHPPHGGTLRGAVVYVHPFAEEMNKARRMAALQSRALARAGHAVLQIDLLGCGDSSGDFADASWSQWADDVALACAWIRRLGTAPLWLWGLRAGCLVAVEAARRMSTPCNFLFWQPAMSGRLVLQQFLRLKVAADMLAGPSKGVMDSLRARLAANPPVEVAGYVIAPALAAGLEHAVLRPPCAVADGRRVEWLELQARTEPTLAPASLPLLEAWRDAGFATRSAALTGPPFWQTGEIEEAPELLAATLAAIADRVPA